MGARKVHTIMALMDLIGVSWATASAMISAAELEGYRYA